MLGYLRPAFSILGLSSALPPSSKVGAVCSNAARTDLCVGPLARTVPTATDDSFAFRIPLRSCGPAVSACSSLYLAKKARLATSDAARLFQAPSGAARFRRPTFRLACEEIHGYVVDVICISLFQNFAKRHRAGYRIFTGRFLTASSNCVRHRPVGNYVCAYVGSVRHCRCLVSEGAFRTHPGFRDCCRRGRVRDRSHALGANRAPCASVSRHPTRISTRLLERRGGWRSRGGMSPESRR